MSQKRRASVLQNLCPAASALAKCYPPASYRQDRKKKTIHWNWWRSRLSREGALPVVARRLALARVMLLSHSSGSRRRHLRGEGVAWHFRLKEPPIQNAVFRTTTDYRVIRCWAEERGGHPALVKWHHGGSSDSRNNLTIDFPGRAWKDSVEQYFLERVLQRARRPAACDNLQK